MTFYDYQLEFVPAFVRAILCGYMLDFTLLWSRQSGKTEAGLQTIITCMIFLPRFAKDPELVERYPQLEKFKDGFRVGFVGPTQGQAGIPFERIREDIQVRGRYTSYLKEFGISILKNNNERFLLSNGSKMDALTAKPGSERKKEGQTYHLLWFEESQELSTYAIRDVFSPMLATTQGVKVFVGTTGERRGEFYNTILRNKEKAPGSHFEFNADRVMLDYPAYKIWHDDFVSKLPGGKANPIYRKVCMLEWILKFGALMSYEAFNRCIADGQAGRPHFLRNQIDYEQEHEYLFTFDFAKIQDKTAGGFWERWDDHYRLLDIMDVSHLDHPVQDDMIIRWIMAKRATYFQKTQVLYNVGKYMRFRVAGDTQGIGDVRLDNIKQKFAEKHNFRPLTHAVNFSASVKDAMYHVFNNCVPLESPRPSKAFWYMPQGEDVQFDTFKREMVDCVTEKRGDLTAFHHPKTNSQVDDGLNPHDDYVDMLMIGLYIFEKVKVMTTY